MSKKGIIFDIQKFSVHDGPGIRTTIFMKGCSLRCKWCHNPESISPVIQLSYDRDKCTLCGKCVEAVKGKGISLIDNRLDIDFSIHNTNLHLIDICPSKAYSASGREVSVREVVEEVLQDMDYYEESGGGVTFSGGEAINQIDFVRGVALELREHGVHICLDISGFDPSGIIRDTVSWVDEYLLDYKVAVKELEEEYLGKRLHFDSIIEYLAAMDKKIILRCPIIPGINDSSEHFKRICNLSNTYSCIDYVDLLPYHNLKKRSEFLYMNSPEEFKTPENEDFNRWTDFIKEYQGRDIYLRNKKI